MVLILISRKENICDHEMFNKDGLMKLLQIAAKQFEKAQMYEYVNEVSTLLCQVSICIH